ncbi:MAG TPA: 2,3-bisphosphoglycerate-independent phosphoglycerate mutase [Candidatus Magasanikbacteria bacterium]|nr:2,3-bisphosphoglycerate-independent phosphoglycerate mutase [Candidatus Magasanikbacteria bacterium]
MPTNKKNPVMLVIMDGWGIASPKNKGNPITPENAPNYFRWLKDFPNTKLEASGEAVGLFKDEEGNSEAGHMNLGAGRVVKQDAVYISDAIKDGTFFKNPAFDQAVHHIKKYNTAVHLIGLLSNHNSAHSCPEHLYALLDYFYQEKIQKVYLHLFTDGRDSGQHDAPKHLKLLKEKFHGNEKIATVLGRFYGMDRGKNWERIKKAYDALVECKSCRTAESAEDALTLAYNSGETDEFIVPTVIVEKNKAIAKINDNDAIFFFNLRSDRARQLTKAFVQPDFEKVNPDSFRRSRVPKNTRFVAMTDFGPDLPGVLTAFPSRDVVNSLTQVLCPMKQLYISETEKFAHVTYFFNGGYAKHFCDDRWIKVESKVVDSYVACPQMSSKQMTDILIKNLEKKEYDFICVNYPNPDMVGHTGDLIAGVMAVKTVDTEVDRLIKTALKKDCTVLVTADHGNVEAMINLKTGEVDTEHSTNPVPLILMNNDFYKKKKQLKKGRLADVAPTILKLFNLKKPKEMTGKSLI